MGDLNGKQGSEWLHGCLSRLSPEVFCHPVWEYFAEPNDPLSPNLIHDLLHAATQLGTQHNLLDACQIRLICAVLQDRSGEHAEALATIKTAWSLAEQHGLPHVAWWAAWGASSLCTGQGDYQQAAEHLNYLRDELQQHNEWILSNIVATVRHMLIDHISASPSGVKTALSPPESMLSIALEWLLRWGEPPLAIERSYYNGASNGLYNGRPPPVFSTTGVLSQGWRSLQHTAKRVIRDRIRPTWKGNTRDPETVTHLSRSLSLPTAPLLKSRKNGSLLCPMPNRPSKQSSSSENSKLSGQANSGPSLTIYCLGPFRVYVKEQLIDKWPGNKCKCIFKYMLVHRQSLIHHEILMDQFWRDVEPEAARRNLYQAIYSLRQALQNGDFDYPYVLCEDSCYRLNPDLNLWVDSEALHLHYQTGQRLEREGHLHKAIIEYELAENLYGGEFLAEDLYADWPVVHRENLKHAHLDILDRLSQFYFEQGQLAMCIAYCQKILIKDNCREDAHRRLMRSYMRQGQRHLALRQYHTCVEALEQELGVPPMPTTLELYRQIQENGVQFPDVPELRRK
jgi:DNA-binding SARP family transcriptional activator